MHSNIKKVLHQPLYGILYKDVAVSCGYDTFFAVKTCDGLCHFIFSIDRVGIPYSEIDQIHLSIEAQCVTTLLPLGDCHTRHYFLK